MPSPSYYLLRPPLMDLMGPRTGMENFGETPNAGEIERKDVDVLYNAMKRGRYSPLLVTREPPAHF